MTHDNAIVLKGKKNGLAGLITEKVKENFIDVSDMCHCINLIFEKALNVFDAEIKDLVKLINSHFVLSPRRRENFHQVQLKNHFKEK